jgi:hypothetical protein
MSVSIQEVIESAGYNLTTKEDCQWLLAQVNQFEELVTAAEDRIEELEYAEQETE